MDVTEFSIDKREDMARALSPIESYTLGVVMVPLTDLNTLDYETKRCHLLALMQRYACLEHKQARVWMYACGDDEFCVRCEVHVPNEVCHIYEGPGYSEALEAAVDTYLYLEDRSWRPPEFGRVKDSPDDARAVAGLVTGVTCDVTRDKLKGVYVPF